MGYIALQSMLIRLFVGKRTTRSWLVAPSPPLWINHHATEQVKLSFQIELRRALGHMTHQGIGQSSGAVAQLVQGLVKFLLLLLNVHAVSSRLSGNKENSYAHAALFIPFFWRGRSHRRSEKKRIRR